MVEELIHRDGRPGAEGGHDGAVEGLDPLGGDGDGGHGMVFHTFDGTPTLVLHRPNDTPRERMVFLPFNP